LELTSVAQRPRVRPRERSLWEDFGRVTAGILLGISGGFIYGFLSRRWDAVFGLVTLVVGPAFALALLWLGTGLQRRTGMRILGASGGWLGFVWLFGTPLFNQWLLSFYAPTIILLVTSLSAASVVGIGLFLADRIWWRIGDHGATFPQPK